MCDLTLENAVKQQQIINEQNGVILSESETRLSLYLQMILEILLAPITNFVLAYVQEYVFRHYLFNMFTRFLHPRVSSLISSFLFALFSIVLCILGDYFPATDYPGAPFTGMLMVVMVRFFLGNLLNFFTLKTNSILVTTFLHSSWISLQRTFIPLIDYSAMEVSVFLGPSFYGIMTSSFLIVASIVVYLYMDNKKKNKNQSIGSDYMQL